MRRSQLPFIVAMCSACVIVLVGWSATNDPRDLEPDDRVAQASQTIPNTYLGRWVGGRLRQPQFTFEVERSSISFNPISNRIRSRSTPPVVARDQREPSNYDLISINGPLLTLESADGNGTFLHVFFWSSTQGIIWQSGEREVGYISRTAALPSELIGEWRVVNLTQQQTSQARRRIVLGEDAYSHEAEGRIEVNHIIPLASSQDILELVVVPARERPYSVMIRRNSDWGMIWEIAEDGNPDRSRFLLLHRADRPPGWLSDFESNAEIGSTLRRRAMRDEVTANIRRIFDASVIFYRQGGHDAAGQSIRHRFPPSTGRTPENVPCTAQEPDPGIWGADTWLNLNFVIWEPFYFSYEYQSSGQGPGATFTISAYGDFDCDGVYSTFTQTGVVLEDNSVQASELLIFNPDE